MGLSSIRKIRYAPTATQSYADLVADATTGYVYPKAMGIETTWGIKQYDRKFQSPDTMHWQKAAGERETAIKFETEMIGFGGAGPGAGAGVAATEGECGLLLKSVFGNETLD